MRLIDADSIIAFINAGHLINPSALSWSDNDVVDMIESRPTIDAVPVVRCRDCVFGCAYNEKWYLPKKDGWWCCIREEDVEQKDYCSRGERKDDESV